MSTHSLLELRDRRAAKRRALWQRWIAVLVVTAAATAVASVSIATGRGGHESAPGTAASLRSGPLGDRTPARTGAAVAPASAKVTIAATGDIAMGRTPTLPPDGGASFFDGVASSLDGDVVLGNLETALATGGASKCGASDGNGTCFAFRSPPSYARWLRRAGFTVMNTANNHSYDFGAEGEAETVAALDRFRLKHTGRPGEIAVQRVRGVRVAVLGFAPYPHAQSLLDLKAARRLVKRADATADLVVVTMHAGAEGADAAHVRPGREVYLGEDRGDPIAFSHAVVDAGADLVVGHGPHVLRGMEWYRGRLIAYSLGNFSGYHNFRVAGAPGVSGILRVTLRADGSWVRGRLVATRLRDPGLPVRDVGEAAHGAVRSLSRQDFGKAGVRISGTGAILPPRS